MSPRTLSIPVITAILTLTMAAPAAEARHCHGHRHHVCCQTVVYVPCCSDRNCKTRPCCTSSCDNRDIGCPTGCGAISHGPSCCNSGCICHTRHHQRHDCCTTDCSVNSCCAQNVVYSSPVYSDMQVTDTPAVSAPLRTVVGVVK